MPEIEGVDRRTGGLTDRLLPKGSIRRGLFYIGVTVMSSWYAGSQIAENSSSQVANELKPTINEQGHQMRQSFDPTKEDVERLAIQGEEMFLSLCVAGLQMQSCPQIMTENGINPADLPNSDEIASPDPSITEIIPTMPPTETTTSTTAP